jgi:hypothetical protein
MLTPSTVPDPTQAAILRSFRPSAVCASFASVPFWYLRPTLAYSLFHSLPVIHPHWTLTLVVDSTLRLQPISLAPLLLYPLPVPKLNATPDPTRLSSTTSRIALNST